MGGALALSLLLNVASLRVFYRYYFGKCSSELVELVGGRSTCFDRLLNFLLPFLDVIRMSMSIVSFYTLEFFVHRILSLDL